MLDLPFIKNTPGVYQLIYKKMALRGEVRHTPTDPSEIRRITKPEIFYTICASWALFVLICCILAAEDNKYKAPPKNKPTVIVIEIN